MQTGNAHRIPLVFWLLRLLRIALLLASALRDAITAIDRDETPSPRLIRVVEFPQHRKHLYAMDPSQPE